jgi:uncharacterized protein (TIGR02231 family)
VRCAGAEVLGVDASDRLEAGAPESRLEELRAALGALEQRLAEQGDEQLVIDGLRTRVESLLRGEERLHAARAEGAAGREERLHWIEEQLSGLGARQREVSRRMQETRRELEDARLALGRAEGGDGTRVVDLAVELAAAGDAPATLEVEYLVARAGWTPVYDLRAPKDLAKVELVYRANVVQSTGEDWTGVELVLSTAEPRRGAAGPQPHTVWLDLARPARGKDVRARDELSSLGYNGEAESPAAASADLDDLSARVEDEGLTVRYRIPRPETIESRPEASSVLIGRADLKAEAERVVVPALDTTVWMRARAVNTSDWVLLPGRAAVYFGADFLGHSELAAVQRNAEFTLHLGADPGVQVERIVLAEKTEEAGVFSSRETFRQSLRFKLRNTGALSAQPNGAVTVALQESIPRSNDERVSVEIAEAKPEPAAGERWKKLREERGVATWLVSVARGEERVVELETEITYPEEFDLVRW